MTATRALAKKRKIFKIFRKKKAFAKGKKLKTRLVRASDKSAFSPNTAARTVPDWRRIPCCASLATRRPRPQKADVRGSEPEKRDADGVGVAVEIESTGGRSGTLEGARANVDFIIAFRRILSTGGSGRIGVGKRRRLRENRRFRNAVVKIFEFRGEFVLFDFVVHRFFANAEFARGETTTTVASDERFEESEAFDLRQRQTGESERRRRRKLGATGRAERNGKRTRRRNGRRKGNVGDRNARFVDVCVASKAVDGASRNARNGSGAPNGRRGGSGGRVGEFVATERRLGRRKITAGKTVEGIHWRGAAGKMKTEGKLLKQ